MRELIAPVSEVRPANARGDALASPRWMEPALDGAGEPGGQLTRLSSALQRYLYVAIDQRRFLPSP